uniref:Uncharacterized protein n=1 Tax=Oryza glaberrima TaxID=4538 RepID=A0A679BAZ4_ORYGL|nr:hypothetical protein [Oryza glaberrima]
MELRGGMQLMQHGGGVRDNAWLVGGGGGGPFIVANKGLEVGAPHARAEVVHAAFVRSCERTGRRVQVLALEPLQLVVHLGLVNVRGEAAPDGVKERAHVREAWDMDERARKVAAPARSTTSSALPQSF